MQRHTSHRSLFTKPPALWEQCPRLSGRPEAEFWEKASLRRGKHVSTIPATGVVCWIPCSTLFSGPFQRAKGYVEQVANTNYSHSSPYQTWTCRCEQEAKSCRTVQACDLPCSNCKIVSSPATSALFRLIPQSAKAYLSTRVYPSSCSAVPLLFLIFAGTQNHGQPWSKPTCKE